MKSRGLWEETRFTPKQSSAKPMPEILTLLTCLTFELNNTSLKHLGCIIMRDVSDDWSGNNAGDIPLGGKRRELSNYSKIFLQPPELADALCGFSFAPIAFVPRKSTLLLGMKWLRPNQVIRPMEWIGSFLVWRSVP